MASEELQGPLLRQDANSTVTKQPDAASTPGGPETPPPVKNPSSHVRLDSLDVQRGLTIAAMVFADEIGEAYPHLNHSPWNNITFADFVMPWFLFMVGMAMAMSLRKFKGSLEKRKEGTWFVFVRTMKLFWLGMAIQGGGWPGDDPDAYSYGYNLWNVRWCGILQRIAFGYFIVALMEIWVPCVNGAEGAGWPADAPDIGNDSVTWRAHARVFTRHFWKWTIAVLFSAVYLALLYGTWVPSWQADVKSSNTTAGSVTTTIQCDVRGDTTPPCAATGYYDRLLFGQKMCSSWMSGRLPDCSSCSPGKCDKSDAPLWCKAPMYDPEGALATFNVVISVWLGLHFGHVLKHPEAAFTQHHTRLWHWTIFSAVLMATGLMIHFAGHAMNKQMWTVSYALFMAGTCGAFLILWYALIDWPQQNERIRRVASVLLRPLQYMGMNAILVFFWHGLAESTLNVVYWQPDGEGTKHNLVTWVRGDIFGALDPRACPSCQLAYVLFKIACFSLGCWYCARVGYFWKL